MTFSAPLTSYYGCATVLSWWPSYPLVLLPSYSVLCSNTHAFCLCHCFILEHFVTFSFHWAILLLFPSSEGSYWPFSIALSHCSTYCRVPLSLTTTHSPTPCHCPVPHHIQLSCSIAVLHPMSPYPSTAPRDNFTTMTSFREKAN